MKYHLMSAFALSCLFAFGTFTAAGVAQTADDDGSYGLSDTLPSGPSDADQQALAKEQKAVQDAYEQGRDANTLTKQPDLDPGKASPGDIMQLAIQLNSLKNQFLAYQEQAKADKQESPDLDPAGGPGLPVHCKVVDAAIQGKSDQAVANGQARPADSGSCDACYTAAEVNIDRSRVALERLRIVGADTKKMANLGISVLQGAGQAGGGPAALEANAQIQKVNASLADFNVTYDAKYDELMQGLKKRLDAFEVCETKYFNNPDWYNRFGFIYYQFMADKYKRS